MRRVIDPHRRRRLGRSDVHVGPLTFGGNALSNLYAVVDEAQALDAVVASYECGVRSFDTAPLYGYGLGEHRLGHALRRFPRDSYVLSTKVGRLLAPHGRVAPAKLSVSEGGIFVDELPFTPVFDYSHDGVLRSVADSLQRLGTNRIDVAFIHDIDRWTHGDAYDERFADVVHGALPALAQLKAEGVIGAIGAGVNEIAACERLATLPQIDCFMLAGRYTLLERDGSAALFAQCIQREIAILAAAPFNSGILATGNVADARYNYLPAPAEIRAAVDALERFGMQHGVALPAAALQFPLQHPAVVSVVAGYRSRSEAEQGAAAFAAPIPAAYWRALAAAPQDLRGVRL